MPNDSGQLAELLTSWRRRMTPEDAGLPAGGNRRITGLRRSELSVLANVSVDYIDRLEQGRATHPSPEVLEALSRALQLTRAERSQLFLAAGQLPEPSGVVPRTLSPGGVRILNRMTGLPAAVFDAAWTYVTGNLAWRCLFGDLSAARPPHSNLVWLHFHGLLGDVIELSGPEREHFEQALVSDLRAALTRYPNDAAVKSLIGELRLVSDTFDSWWRAGVAVEHLSETKTLRHPEAGVIRLDCDILVLPGNDLRMVVYTAAPGTEDANKLDFVLTLGQAHHNSRS